MGDTVLLHLMHQVANQCDNLKHIWKVKLNWYSDKQEEKQLTLIEILQQGPTQSNRCLSWLKQLCLFDTRLELLCTQEFCAVFHLTPGYKRSVTSSFLLIFKGKVLLINILDSLFGKKRTVYQQSGSEAADHSLTSATFNQGIKTINGLLSPSPRFSKQPTKYLTKKNMLRFILSN